MRFILPMFLTLFGIFGMVVFATLALTYEQFDPSLWYNSLFIFVYGAILLTVTYVGIKDIIFAFKKFRL